MAYARKRKTATKARRRRSSTRSTTRGTRRVRRTTARPRRATSRRRSSGGGRTIKLEIVQAAPSGLSPLTQMLLDQKKVVMPKRARF